MTASATLYPTTAATTGTTWSTTGNGAVGSTTGTSDVATFTNATSGGVGTLTLSGYAAAAALGVQPASLTSVVLSLRSWVATTSRWTAASCTAQLFSGATAIGSAVAIGTLSTSTSNVYTVTFNGANLPTWAQLTDLQVKVTATHSGTTSDTFQVDTAGLVVNYTPNQAWLLQSVLSSTTSGTTNVASLPATSAAGSIIIAAITDFSNDFGSVTDNKGNTYNRIATAQHANTSNDYVHLFYAVNTTGGAGHTVTYTMTGTPGASDSNVAVYEWGGLSTSITPVGQGAVAAATATNSPGAITPTTGAALIFAVGCDDAGNDAAPTPATNYTLLLHQDDSSSHERHYAQALYQTTTSTTTASFTLAASSNTAAIVAVFPPPIAGAATATGTAYQTTATVGARAAAVTATGAAPVASTIVPAAAGNAAGGGAALAPQQRISVFAPAATGTGTANAPLGGTGNVAANAGAATGAGTARSPSISRVTAGGRTTLTYTTIQPNRALDVDDAELESLTRQGLIVDVSAPPRPSSPPDTITAHVRTTLNPQVLIGVGAAELESLTRQGLIYSVGA